jgi:hypothetical protein
MSHSRRVLLVMVDNRNFNYNIDTLDSLNIDQYLFYALIINHMYATNLGYEFLYVRPTYKDLRSNVSRIYGKDIDEHAFSMIHDQSKFGWSSPTKQEPTTFNTKLKQYRATPWMKIPVLWYLNNCKQKNESFDTIFYIDSDAVLNPSFIKRSLDESYVIWSLPGAIEYGPHPKESPLTFFSNAPYSHQPCDGGILVNPKNPRTNEILLEWWNYNNEPKNFVHEFEQNSLWALIEKYPHIYRKEITYLHSEKQFPPCDRNWFCHYGHPWKNIRMKELGHMIEQLYGKIDHQQMHDILTHIKMNHTIELELFKITQMM